jgi:hypothetical protein
MGAFAAQPGPPGTAREGAGNVPEGHGRFHGVERALAPPISLAQYNDAISRIEAIAACADEGKKKLENGKTLAERHLMQIKLKQEPKKGKKKPAKGKAEAKQKLPGKEPKKESKRKLAGKKSTSSDDEREMKKYFKGAL